MDNQQKSQILAMDENYHKFYPTYRVMAMIELNEQLKSWRRAATRFPSTKFARCSMSI